MDDQHNPTPKDQKKTRSRAGEVGGGGGRVSGPEASPEAPGQDLQESLRGEDEHDSYAKLNETWNNALLLDDAREAVKERKGEERGGYRVLGKDRCSEDVLVEDVFKLNLSIKP